MVRGWTRVQAAGRTDNDRFICAPQAGKLAPSKSRASPPDRGSLATALWPSYDEPTVS